MARLNPKERKEQILITAVKLSEKYGYSNIRRDDVAKQAGVSMGLVNNYFNTMQQLKRAVIRHAVKCEILPIVAQGILAKDKQVSKISDDLKKRAIESI